MSAPDPSPWLTLRAAAALLGVSRQRVWQLVDAGRLTGRLVTTPAGSYWEVERASVLAFERQPEGRPRKPAP